MLPINPDTPPPPGPRYPFGDLQAGQSFDLPPGGSINGLRAAASRYGKRTGRRFTIRTLPGNIVRCWRLPDNA